MRILPVLVLLVSSAAQPQPTAPQRSPNEQICRTNGEIGSRLNRTRTCKTGAEWEEARREQRNTIDRAQRQSNPTADETRPGT